MGKPDSRIVICSGVRLNSKYEHSIYFPSVDAQREYFAGKAVKTFSAVSYVRRFWDLKVDADIEEARFWNYVYVINGQNPNDYQYYFINNIEYNNEHSVILKLELDVIQTYLDRCTLQPCFVERQHVTDDTIGANTVEEDLDLGSYTNNNRYDVDELKNLITVIMSTEDLSETIMDTTGFFFHGVFSGIRMYCTLTPTSVLAGISNPDQIINIFMFPKALTTVSSDGDLTGSTATLVNDFNITLEKTMMRPRTLDGYQPRNNKLFTHPYSFIYATNNSGGAGVFRWEKFKLNDNDQCVFNVTGLPMPDGGCRLTPIDYNGIGKNIDESLSIVGFPFCAWTADEYKIWLAQNMNQQSNAMSNVNITTAVGIAGGVATMIGGAVTANPLGIGGGIAAAGHSALSGYSQVKEMLALKADMEARPPQARGSTSASLNVRDQCQTFSLYDRCVNYERAEIIDNYFSLYGYRINRVQTPNIHARQDYTYVKTIGCHVHGNLNNADIQAIENVFNNGITFWTDGDQIGEYRNEVGNMKLNPTL